MTTVTKLNFYTAAKMRLPQDCPYQPLSFDELAALGSESIAEIFTHWAERNEIDRGKSPEFEIDKYLTAQCLRWVLRGKTVHESVQIIRSKLCLKHFKQDGYQSPTDVAAAINRCLIAGREKPNIKPRSTPKKPKKKKSTQFPSSKPIKKYETIPNPLPA
jgi:hypothetical protein